MSAPIWAGDRVRLVGDDPDHGQVGTVAHVLTWREAILGMRPAEARAFTAAIDARMAAHGGRTAWARLTVQIGARPVAVEAPGYVLVARRADGIGDDLPVAPAEKVV